MPMRSPCRRCYDDLPISVDVEFLDQYRGQSWRVDFAYWRHLWIDCELPWQCFRWHYRQSNIENTITFLLTTLGAIYVIVSDYKSVGKLEYVYIYIYIYIYISNSHLSLVSFHALRSPVYPLSTSKLVLHYIPACEIVPHNSQTTRSDFWYNYFIRSMSMKESR